MKKIGYSAIGTFIGISLYKKMDIQKLSIFNHKITIINFIIISTLLVGNFLKWLIFGKLSTIEIKNLQKKINYTLWEFSVSFFIINDKISNFNDFLKYGALFSFVFFLKMFHYLSIDRFKYLQNMRPSLIHLRFLFGLILLNVIDLILIRIFYCEVFLQNNYNILIFIFGFEMLNLFPLIFNNFLVFSINLVFTNFNLRFKKIYYVLDFLSNLIRFMMFFIFSLFFMNFFTIPFHILPSSYQCFRLLITKTRKLINYKKKSLMFDKFKKNSNFKRVTIDGIDKSGSNCCFCFDSVGLNTEIESIQLNCDHVFHIECFKNWLLISKKCPICRSSLSNEKCTNS